MKEEDKEKENLDLKPTYSESTSLPKPVEDEKAVAELMELIEENNKLIEKEKENEIIS